jgi:hypothetical protein
MSEEHWPKCHREKNGSHLPPRVRMPDAQIGCDSGLAEDALNVITAKTGAMQAVQLRCGGHPRAAMSQIDQT